MELSSSNIKKFFYSLKRKLFLYFLKRKLFLYFRKRNPVLLSPSSNNKRNPPQEISYTSGNGNPEKKSYISGNGKPETETLKSFFYFRR